MIQDWNMYITLPSTSNRKEFPKNKLSNYRVKLSNRLKLKQGKHEIALTEITFPTSWYNITTGKISIKKTENDGTETVQILNIYPGSISSPKKLIERINQYAQEMKFNTLFSLVYEEYSNMSSLIVYISGYDVMLSDDLSKIFGFTSEKYYSLGVHKAQRTTDMYTSCQLMYVYSDIVSPRPVGNIQSPLLRSIPISEKFNQNVLKEFSNPQYVQVNTMETDIINIVLTTDEGKEIDFQNGKVSLTLHIRSVS